jgi:DNA repair exonuclease SbcCD ATPase subunit
LKRVCRQRQDRINELEGAMGKENVTSNITKPSAIENENQMLKKKLQELEDMQTDDVKATVKADTELREEFERLQKKYDMTRRLCNLRNDDISTLKTQVAQLNEQIVQMQANFQLELEKWSKKYTKVRDLCQMRTDKLNNLRERFGVTAESSAEPKAAAE